MKQLFSILLIVAVVVVAAMAQAQQPTKVPRIGYLKLQPPFPLSRPASRHSARVCASLATWRGKTLSLSGDLQRENSIASRRLPPS